MDLTFSQISKSKFFRQVVVIKAFITGKALTPYYVPKNVKIECKPKRTCKNCAVYHSKERKLTLHPENHSFIKFIGIADFFMASVLREAFNIAPRCGFKYDITSMYTVEEVYMTDISIEKYASYISRVGYAVDFPVECNVPYEFECYAIPEPRQQKIVHVIFEGRKLKTDIDSFEMGSAASKKLQIFKTEMENPEAVFKYLEKLYGIYASSVTKIYKRFDLHMAIDLVFHSPLQFYFNGEFVNKGWLDVIVIGDTRCGKGFVTEGFIRYYGAGEVVSGENVSFAGLVGGLQQMNNRWIVTWGKIPLNNKRLIIIDESGEMEPKDFSKLSRIRSEGIAEITKIQTERAVARTRLIFLSNPKHRLISTYSFGIEAIFDLVENSEDMARFDYVLIIAQNEVDVNEINQYRGEELKNPYKEADPVLVQWIWSRKPEQIKFTEEATEFILKSAVKLGNTYSPKIPIVQGEDIRIKLAKIAAAIAGRLFSTDEAEENIIVEKIHAESAYVFINMIYKKKSSGYFYYSQIQKQTSEIYDLKHFERYMRSFENFPDLIEYFITNNYITLSDLSEHTNQPRDIAREVISKLLHHRCIQKKFTFYVKNQCFTEWLRKI